MPVPVGMSEREGAGVPVVAADGGAVATGSAGADDRGAHHLSGAGAARGRERQSKADDEPRTWDDVAMTTASSNR